MTFLAMRAVYYGCLYCLCEENLTVQNFDLLGFDAAGINPSTDSAGRQAAILRQAAIHLL
jgi:hypothetical protein